MAMTRKDVEFTKNGAIHDATQVDALLQALPGVTDLLVVSHGWNNDMAEARALYDELLGNIEKLLAIRDAQGAPAALRRLSGRTFGVCQVFWPSKRFADSDLIPGGGAASAIAAVENHAATERLIDELAREPELLRNGNAAGGVGARNAAVNEARAAIAGEAKDALRRLDTDPDAPAQYLDRLRALLDPAHVHADDGSVEFFSKAASELFDDLSDDVFAPPPVVAGGAASVGNASGAAGLVDLLKGIGAAARRLANFATYYQMKAHAGTVGSGGLATVLSRCRSAQPTLKLHLVGHSFGGRVVTASAHAMHANTPAITMSLLQAAFSHNGLSGDFDDRGSAGFYRAIVSERRASGPIIITHTKNDTAVGIAYPLASRIAREKAAALGDEKDPYGGMGRNGARRTVEADGHATTLAPVGKDYGFACGSIYNLRADQFIKNHGDVSGLQVAFAILSAAGVV